MSTTQTKTAAAMVAEAKSRIENLPPSKVASEIDASGTLNGQNVPIEAVRSLGTIIGVLSRTFFGA